MKQGIGIINTGACSYVADVKARKIIKSISDILVMSEKVEFHRSKLKICNIRHYVIYELSSFKLKNTKEVIMLTNNTILNISNNRITEIQGGLIEMLIKKRNRKHAKNIVMRKQQQSDYVRFNLDSLSSLL
ncbi:MAG: hypothetical protein JEZ08_12815 [Clostridiales bacterium]|nr:hypothetical protein [Clostridiales bacterium]